MKKDEIQIGQTYIAEVRITGENPHGGWRGVNVATNRAVSIKSAQRIRSLVSRPARRQVAKTLDEAETANGAPAKRVMTKAEYEAQVAAPVSDVGPGAATTTEAADGAQGQNQTRHGRTSRQATQRSGRRGGSTGRGGNAAEHQGDGGAYARDGHVADRRQDPGRDHLRRNYSGGNISPVCNACLQE
jgi:hypothetical protein